MQANPVTLSVFVCLYIPWDWASKTRKPCCRKETVRCRSSAVLFGLKFADNVHYKFKSSQALKAMLQSSKHTDTKQNLTQNGHSGSFQITCFGVSGKAIMYWIVLNTNVGLIGKGSNDVSSLKVLQFFCGFQIFCGSRSASAHLRWSRV